MSRTGLLELASLIVVVAVSGCTRDAATGPRPREEGALAQGPVAPTRPARPPRLEGPAFPRDASALTAELTAIDADIAKIRARVEDKPRAWTAYERIANLQLQRARLSGSYDDYAAARASLDEAFARAPAGAGPVLTRASLNFTLHRLAEVEPDLRAYEAQPILDDPSRAGVAAMRGDVEFERGNYQAARAHYDAALALSRSPSLLAKLGQWHWRMGAHDQAEALYREALAQTPERALEPRAWVHLQLGIMDLERGRLDDALAHYRDGAQILGGWWLIEEHVAEIAALQGHDAFALALYDDIIARTGKPEFMDAKASLLAAAGDAAGAAALVERARAAYEADLIRFPEASQAHALAHFLEFGPPERALALATRNAELRPGAPAKILLAQARLAVDDLTGAREVIDAALASGWVSAELDWVASQVYARLGDSARALALQRSAEAQNPRVARP